MKIIVTGHRGYIGRVLVPMLLAQGHEVLGIDINLYTKYDIEPQKIENPKFKELEKDIRLVIPKDLKGYDVIIHLAGISNDPMGEKYKALTKDVNCFGSCYLAFCAKYVGVKRFIFSSSCSVYGKMEGNKPLTELDRVNPLTEYARSKVQMENYLQAIVDEKFTVVIMRNATVFGYSPALRLDLVVNQLMASGLLTNTITIKSDGTPRRPIIYINDLCYYFLQMIDAPFETITGHIYNIGDKEYNLSIKEIGENVADVLKHILEKEIPLEFLNQDPDARSYWVNFDKIKMKIGSLPFTFCRELIELYVNLKNITFEKLRDCQRLQQLEEIEPIFPTFFQIHGE